jgi:hypothetical protein
LRGARDVGNRSRRIDRRVDRPRNVQRDNGVDGGVGEHDAHGRGESLRRRVAAHVDRVRARALGRQDRVERFDRAGAKRASSMPASCALSAASIPGPRPFATIAMRSPCGMRPDASRRATAKSCVYVRTRTVPLRRTAASNTGIRRRPDVARLHRASALSSTTGLARAGRTKRRQEAPRLVHLLEVEQDAVGLDVGDQRVEQLADVDVEHAAERDHGREAEAERQREVEHRRADGARLRHDASLPGSTRTSENVAFNPMPVRITPNAPGPTSRMPCFEASEATSRDQRRASADVAGRRRGEQESCARARIRGVAEDARHRVAGDGNHDEVDALADRSRRSGGTAGRTACGGAG